MQQFELEFQVHVHQQPVPVQSPSTKENYWLESPDAKRLPKKSSFSCTRLIQLSNTITWDFICWSILSVSLKLKQVGRCCTHLTSTGCIFMNRCPTKVRAMPSVHRLNWVTSSTIQKCFSKVFPATGNNLRLQSSDWIKLVLFNLEVDGEELGVKDVPSTSFKKKLPS